MTMYSIYAPRYLDAYSRIRHGQLLCTRCIELAVDINDIHLDSRGRTLPSRQSAELSEHLSSFTATEADDPLRTGFLRHLNTVFNRLFMKLVDFESSLDLANRINRDSHPAFATIHGDHGVTDIVEIENADPPIALPQSAFSQSPLLVDTPINILPQASTVMPNLLLLPREGMFDPFLTGNLRTGYALGWAARTFLAMNGQDADNLTLIEYGPRMSIGTMVLAARMGMNVFWKEPAPQAWVHTMHQLARLPHRVRSRISFMPAGEYTRTHIAVWNMPWPSIGIYRLGADLVSHGLLVFQSELSHSTSPDYWRVRAAIDLPDGEYIFPSSFAHIAPRTFQVWQNFGR